MYTYFIVVVFHSNKNLSDEMIIWISGSSILFVKYEDLIQFVFSFVLYLLQLIMFWMSTFCFTSLLWDRCFRKQMTLLQWIKTLLWHVNAWKFSKSKKVELFSKIIKSIPSRVNGFYLIWFCKFSEYGYTSFRFFLFFPFGSTLAPKNLFLAYVWVKAYMQTRIFAACD